MELFILIDLHSHILPGIDDGAKSLDDAIAMAQAAVADGITMLAATPHHNNGRYTNPAQSTRDAIIALNAELVERHIPLTVVTGQEVRVNDRFWSEFQEGQVLTLHHSKYLLVELPTTHVPKDFSETVHELLIAGIVPMIAHPERNTELANNPDKLADLVNLGALAQMTTHSLCGRFGRKLRKQSLEMCRRNLIHIVASDAHDIKHRPFSMREAYAVIENELGAEYSSYYEHNASAVIYNQDILSRTTLPASKRRYLWW
jgi:protein-tyrosine phosphatase